MNDLTVQDGGALLERVIVQGDLSKLTPTERVVYYKQVCERCGLDPLMKPLEFITLNNKLVLYALRAATDQLRKLHHVSIEILNRERVDDTYLVTARAILPDGRTDESMGAVNLKGLTGDALANAYLKCETKAKRRVTLSICGLGMLDETEVDSIPGARITPSAGVEEQLTSEEMQQVSDVVARMKEHHTIDDMVYEMENATLNAEQQIVLWRHFEATPRRLMKAEQARLRKVAEQAHGMQNVPAISGPEAAQGEPVMPEVISPAAHKRLEARISELKLDREAVKKYVKDTFGRDHFTEMTKDEYDKLDKTIEIRAAAKERKDKLAQPATEDNGP